MHVNDWHRIARDNDVDIGGTTAADAMNILLRGESFLIGPS